MNITGPPSAFYDTANRGHIMRLFAAIVSAVADHRRRTTARAQQDRAYAMAVEADRVRAG